MTRLAQACKLAALGAFAAATIVFASVLLWALNDGGEARLPIGLGVKIAAGSDRMAEALLRPIAPSARSQKLARALSLASIHQYPYDTSAWLRIAYIDRLSHSALTPAGINALKLSYDLVGADPDVGQWRVRFCWEAPEPATFVTARGRRLPAISAKPLRRLVRRLLHPNAVRDQ